MSIDAHRQSEQIFTSCFYLFSIILNERPYVIAFKKNKMNDNITSIWTMHQVSLEYVLSFIAVNRCAAILKLMFFFRLGVIFIF